MQLKSEKPFVLRMVFIVNALMAVLPFIFYGVVKTKEITVPGIPPAWMLYTGLAYSVSFIFLVTAFLNKKLQHSRFLFLLNIIIALPAKAYIGILVALISLWMAFRNQKFLNYFIQ